MNILTKHKHYNIILICKYSFAIDNTCFCYLLGHYRAELFLDILIVLTFTFNITFEGLPTATYYSHKLALGENYKSLYYLNNYVCHNSLLFNFLLLARTRVINSIHQVEL